QDWRDNMSAQLKMVSYMRPDGVFDANIGVKRAQDPRFAEALRLSNDRNNTTAAWTQQVLALFGGDAPRDSVQLSDAAKATAGAWTSPAATPQTAAYQTGSIVSTRA